MKSNLTVNIDMNESNQKDKDKAFSFFEEINPSAVFFDYDGTLIDSLPMLVNAHNHARMKLSLPPITQDHFLKYFGMPRDELYRDLYQDHAKDGQALFEDYYRNNHIKDLRVIDGAGEIFPHLGRYGIACGIVSNKKADFLRIEAEALGWAEHCGAVVGSGDALADKPAPDLFLTAVKQACPDVPIESCLYVGDTITDCQMALAAGCPFIAVQPLPDLQDEGASLPEKMLLFDTFQDFSEIFIQFLGQR